MLTTSVQEGTIPVGQLHSDENGSGYVPSEHSILDVIADAEVIHEPRAPQRIQNVRVGITQMILEAIHKYQGRCHVAHPDSFRRLLR